MKTLQAVFGQNMVVSIPDLPEVVKPVEGKPFMVDLQNINKDLFHKKRENPEQENFRNLFREAMKEVKSNPKKYKKKFFILIPENTWGSNLKKVETLINVSNEEQHLATWVEWSLWLAQRLSNGETWEEICNLADTSECYLLVQWGKDLRMVGGSKQDRSDQPPCNVERRMEYYPGDFLRYTVPLIVLEV